MLRVFSPGESVVRKSNGRRLNFEHARQKGIIMMTATPFRSLILPILSSRLTTAFHLPMPPRRYGRSSTNLPRYRMKRIVKSEIKPQFTGESDHPRVLIMSYPPEDGRRMFPENASLASWMMIWGSTGAGGADMRRLSAAFPRESTADERESAAW